MAGEYLVVNPRRRRRRARRARRRPARHRRSKLFQSNPRRRRRRVGMRRRHRVRRNPRAVTFGGLNLGNVAFTTAGFFGTRIVTAFASNMLPAELKAQPFARIGIKAAVGLGLPFLLRGFVGRGVSNWLLLGGGIAVAADLLDTFVMPAIGLPLADYEADTLMDYETGTLGLLPDQPANIIGGASGVYSGGIYG